jgi:hypothetical protein
MSKKRLKISSDVADKEMCIMAGKRYVTIEEAKREPIQSLSFDLAHTMKANSKQKYFIRYEVWVINKKREVRI